MPYSTYYVYFDEPVNVSLQAKPTTVATATSNQDGGAWDVIYYTQTTSGKQSGGVQLFGDCVEITSDRKRISVYVDDTTPLPVYGAYFLFSKSSKVNTDGLTGYFAEVKMNNDSTDEIELFAVSSEVTMTTK